MNINASTAKAIGQVVMGARIQTSVFLNATYLTIAAHPMFNIKGVLNVFYFGIEAITQWSADATTIKFYYDPSTPATAQVDLCTASGALTNLAVGKRVAVLADALATGALESANPGVSLTTNPIMVGTIGGVGVLGIEAAAAAQTGATATSQVTLCYVPMSDDAYVAAAI